jgi:hypothetical protein
MVSSTTIIIIVVVAVVLIVAIAAIVIYVSSRPSNSGGVTGASGGCTSICTSYPLGCNATNQLTVGFTGSSCPSSCSSTTQSVTVSGCVAPVCNSIYCSPQQAQYTSLNSSNTLYNQCSSGATGSGFFPNPCTDQTSSGAYLASLTVQPSNIPSNQIYPIFITTIQNSIYQPTQPSYPNGVPAGTLNVSTDPTVKDDPWLLYWDDVDTLINFRRLSDIVANYNLSGAIWIYDTDNNFRQLYPFSLLNSTNGITIRGAYDASGGNYIGSNGPCSFDYIFPGQGSRASSIIYNGLYGYFQFTQVSGADGTTYTGYISETNSSITDNDGKVRNNIVAGMDYSPSINFGGTCTISDLSRWYSISAINQYL